MSYPVLDQYLLSQFLEMESLGELNENSVHTLNQLIYKYGLRLSFYLGNDENSFCITNKGDSSKILQLGNRKVYVRSFQFSKPWFCKPRVKINTITAVSDVGTELILYPFKWVEIPGAFDQETKQIKMNKHFGRFSITRFVTDIYISDVDYQKYKKQFEGASSQNLIVSPKKKLSKQERRIKALDEYLIALGLDLLEAPFSKDEHGFESRAHAWEVLNEEFPGIFGVLGDKTIDAFFDNQNLIKFKENKGVLKQ